MNNEPDLFLHQQQKFLVVAIALTSLYTQIATIMSLPAQNPAEAKVYWTDNETTRLVHIFGNIEPSAVMGATSRM